MPFYKGIYYADGTTPMSIGTITAAQANSTGDTIDSLKLNTSVPVANQSARDALFPTPVQGNAVWRKDLGYEERYFEVYSIANTGGATPAGWYPTFGNVPLLSYGMNASQAIGTGMTNLNFNSGVVQSIANGITFTPSTGIAQVVTPGIYRISGQTHFQGTGAGSRILSIVKNGVALISNYQQPATPGGWGIEVTTKLNAGDTINLGASATVATTTYPGGAYWTSLAIQYIAPGQQ